MNSENALDNGVTLPPINLNSSGIKGVKSKSFTNSTYNNNIEDNSQNDYAEAFNQISNAKFRVMTRLEKLKHEKAKKQFFLQQEENFNNGFPYDQREIYDNFNQVYSYINPSTNEFEQNGNKNSRGRSNKNNYSNDFDFDYINNNKNNINLNNRNGINKNMKYGGPNKIPYENTNALNPFAFNMAPPGGFAFANQPFGSANSGLYPGNYNYHGMQGNSYHHPPNNNFAMNLYGSYLASLANANMMNNNQNNNQNNNNSREKVVFPKILMGMPVNPDGTKAKSKANNKNGKDVSNQEILSALRNLITGKRNETQEEEDNKNSEDEIAQKENEEEEEEKNERKLSPKKEKKPKNKKRKKENKEKMNTDKWWNLLRDFAHIGTFYNSAKKHSKAALVRNKEISDVEPVFPKYFEVLKKWQIQIQAPLWNELKKADLNLSFTNSTPKPKFTENSQKLMALINLFIKNLLSKSAKNVDIPEVILQILFKVIKSKTFYPKNYLNSFELNRLNFGLNGDVKNFANENVMGMLIAFLVISKSAIQTIFLKPIGNIEQVKTFKNIEISMRFVGSILHLILQDAFAAQLPVANDKISLFNYFRNYKIVNAEVEKQKDTIIAFGLNGVGVDSSFQMPDRDSLNGALIDEAIFKEFMQLNKNWVEAVKKYILQWSIGLARYIKLKYDK